LFFLRNNQSYEAKYGTKNEIKRDLQKKRKRVYSFREKSRKGNSIMVHIADLKKFSKNTSIGMGPG